MPCHFFSAEHVALLTCICRFWSCVSVCITVLVCPRYRVRHYLSFLSSVCFVLRPIMKKGNWPLSVRSASGLFFFPLSLFFLLLCVLLPLLLLPRLQLNIFFVCFGWVKGLNHPSSPTPLWCCPDAHRCRRPISRRHGVGAGNINWRTSLCNTTPYVHSLKTRRDGVLFKPHARGRNKREGDRQQKQKEIKNSIFAFVL